MPEIIGNEKDMEWISPASMPSVALKVLAPYKETKSWFHFGRFDPGTESQAHTHPSAEYNYTLEGQWEYKGKIYGPGTYWFIPEGVEHGPIKVVGDKPWVFIVVLTGLTGLEETMPELKPYME